MFKNLLFGIALLLLTAAQAAAEPRNFAVLPFTVHGPQEYQYLSQGIQSMLTTRLTWPEHFAPLDAGVIKKAAGKLPADEQAAKKISLDLGADYLFWGALTVVGQDCNLDINALDLSGKNQVRTVHTTLGQLIPELENTTRQMNAQIFGKQDSAEAPKAKPVVTPMNPGMIVNETQSNTVYANPSLKYQDMDASMGRWRSQSFPFASLGMVVCDGDGDGKNEVFILTSSSLIAFQVADNQLRQLALLDLPKGLNYLRLNTIDMNRDGHHELIIAAAHDKDPQSFVVSYETGKFSLVYDRVPYFLGVLNTPPTFAPTLVGQEAGRTKYLDSKIYQMVKSSGRLSFGPPVDLPADGNVFNTTFLPEGDSYKITVIDDNDHMRVYSAAGSILATTEEAYAGSNLGIDYSDAAMGLQADKKNVAAMSRIFVPLRVIPCNLDKDSRYELLLSRDISVSAQIFTNYRDFPQGEIHSIYWDGVGMNLQWKTARIKGTVTDYCLADIDNDGSLDLVVSMNSHTGAVGVAQKKAVIVAYPLDLSKASAQHQIQKSEQ